MNESNAQGEIHNLQDSKKSFEIISIISIKIGINKVMFATVVEANTKTPFLELLHRGVGLGRFYFPWMAPLYSKNISYNAEC